MSFTADELAYGQKISLDKYLKNKPPVDQVNIAHPLYQQLNRRKQSWGGGLQNVVEQLMFTNDSNFQSFWGAQEVEFNDKRVVDQAKYAWGNTFDGFFLDWDRLAQNGIKIVPEGDVTSTSDEEVQLTNVLDVNNIALVKGFEDGLDRALHTANTPSDPNLPPGLDHLVSTTPSASSVVGTIPQNTATWWRNTAYLNVDPAVLLATFQDALDDCILYGNEMPDIILAGRTIRNEYKAQSSQVINRRVQNGGVQQGGTSLDPGVTDVYFQGIPVIWDPVFELLDSIIGPSATPWTNRAYFLNFKNMKLRPIEGYWMVKHQPPRVYNRFVSYFGLTSKYAVTMNKRRNFSVIELH